MHIGAGLTILAATGLMMAAACSSDDTSSTGGTGGTTTTTSHSGGTGGTTPTGGGGAGGGGVDCEGACGDLYTCATGGTPVRCPGMEDLTLDQWLNGETTDAGTVAGCIATCEAQPALAAIVDPEHCDDTINLLKAANPTFKATCEGAGGGGGAGGASGGAGGS
jgi:hypothetical protein